LESKFIRLAPPETFKDLPIHLEPSDGVWLCGGAVKDLLNGDTPADYDLFGFTVDHLVAFELEYLVDSPRWKQTYSSNEVRSYTEVETGEKVQLIFRDERQGTPEEVIGNFPFVINQFAFDGISIITTQQALDDNTDKVIRLNSVTSQNCIDCIVRIAKYSQKGYILAISSLYKLINTIKETDYKILETELNNSIRVGRCGQLREEKTRVKVKTSKYPDCGDEGCCDGYVSGLEVLMFGVINWQGEAGEGY
jgi:hypothetical protein